MNFPRIFMKNAFNIKNYCNKTVESDARRYLNKCRKFSSSSSVVAKSTMRFVQFKRKNDAVGYVRLGAVSENGSQLTELSDKTVCANDMITFIKQNITLAEIGQKLKNLPSEEITDQITLLPPVRNPEKIICIGLNYSGHCKEQNKEPPPHPMFFSKYANALVGPTANVIAHKITQKIDWEVELAVIIGKEARKVTKENAYDYIFGYTVAQDISARDWQGEWNGGQFLMAKAMDSFCPLGPSLVHKSLIPDPHSLTLTTKVNGVLKQEGNTNELIYRIDDIVSRLSQGLTLKAGDIILTGTPSGVGAHRKPPEFLKPGDIIETEIECLGKMINKVVADD